MIITLTLIDFMAHARTVLDLAPGLNVLCGPNNTGKSAVVEALRCLVTNPSPRHVIRHGAGEARVEALLDSGHRVCWVRRKSHAIYEVYAPGAPEPDIYAKLGKSGVPEDVARLLRLSPVSFEKGQEVDVHLGDQRHPIFLLDQPGSLLADFLASSTESAHLMAMQDLLREKVRGARKGLKAMEESVARSQSGLERLEALPGICLELEGLRAEGRGLEEACDAVPRLAASMGGLARLAGDVRATRRRASVLDVLEQPPLPAPSAALAASLSAMDASRRRAEAARAFLGRLVALKAPPELGGAGRLGASLKHLRSGEAVLSGASRRLGRLSGLAEPPAVADPAPLAELIARMEGLFGRIEKGRDWLAQRGTDLTGLAGRIASRLAEVGECPLCGSAMEAERFLKKAGGRGTS